MFSKKMVMIIGVVFLIAVNMVVIFVTSTRQATSESGGVAISLIAPFQAAVTNSIGFVKDTWRHYFYLVTVSRENDHLKTKLSLANEKNDRLNEVVRSNFRLRKLLNFQETIASETLAAEVIGKDPSLWYKTIGIDKGAEDGVRMGLPVVTPEGVVGQVIQVSDSYAKVMLIINYISGVDVLVQRTRARGIIKGSAEKGCRLEYVLRKHDVRTDDVIISSGLDGVFPKGQRVGRVSAVLKRKAGVFQEITVIPYVDFEKLEEVLVVTNPPELPMMDEQ
ncbi:MAG: rod shape-determining protein MreC [Desulfobacterales bacterium]|nr:rod shape-determining protein MreC [Desulfobacterales bacterium]